MPEKAQSAGLARGQLTLAAPRKLVLWPDPVLLRKALPIETIDAAVHALIDDMLRVMRQEEGAGLAAPQVGESVRLFLVEARPPEDGPHGVRPPEPVGVYINPRIVALEGPVEPYEEGCLSLPDLRVDIRRPPVVTIEATDREGRVFTRSDNGILARIWQHEFDHIEGVLILDRMSPIDRLATKKQLKELRAEYDERTAR